MFSADLLVPALIASIAAYLLGSVSTAIIVCRAMQLPDPRSSGSGNPGTTNVLRVGGKVPAALTLLGDGLKGWLPVVATSLLTDHPPTIMLAALAAFLGHLYPVFFDFRGGKGVATALGALLGVSVTAGALALLTWLAVSLASRMSSAAALVAFLLAPAYLLMNDHRVAAIGFVGIAGFLFYSHRGNIQRIVTGTESRIGR